MFLKHFFLAGPSLPLLDSLYTFDLGGYLGWFRTSDDSDPTNTGVHVLSYAGSMSVNSKDGRDSLYLTTVSSIPRFLLWFQGKVRDLSSRTMIDGHLRILNLLIKSEYPRPHRRPIPSPFNRYRYLDR
jgi:hypothetical protein